MKDRKKRLFGRKDGRRLKTVPAISMVSPFIMRTRTGSQNFIRDSVETGAIDRYILKKRAQGQKSFGITHVLIAAYVRIISQRPAINRFISGQRIYARNNIEVVMTIKKEMTLEAPDTVIKVVLDHAATADEVYMKLNDAIESYRKNPGGDFDNVAKLLSYIPRIFLRLIVWFLELLDYFGLLPVKLMALSPFHGSFFITSMGSLGIPPIYHHLYDFGNLPVFCSFGARQKGQKIGPEGTKKEYRYIDFTFVTDERICDGFYFASALKMMKNILKNPDVLDEPPWEIIEDID